MSTASFSSYDDLVQSVERWLARDDLTEDVKGFIWLAECDIQREVRLLMTDAIRTGTTIAGEDHIHLPNDYAEGGVLRFPDDSSLAPIELVSWSTLDDIQKWASNSATVRVGAVIGDKVYLGPIPGAVDYELIYRAGVQHLNSTIRTNRLLQLYPDCLLFGALVCSAPFLKDDPRLATWTMLYEHAKEATRKAEQRARMGPGPLRMRPDVQVI